MNQLFPPLIFIAEACVVDSGLSYAAPEGACVMTKPLPAWAKPGSHWSGQLTSHSAASRRRQEDPGGRIDRKWHSMMLTWLCRAVGNMNSGLAINGQILFCRADRPDGDD